MNIFELREEIAAEKLDEKSVPDNYLSLFTKWYKQAAEAKIYEPGAFALATADKIGNPSCRMLLLKGFDKRGFIFFTNYDGRKATHLAENNHAAMVFYWGEIERQVRIEGIVEKISAEESDSYFETRPVGSRLGAWASPQSQPINSREWLEKAHNDFFEKFNNKAIPRPENWGGYLLSPTLVEFWQGRPNRLHDRIQYSLDGLDWKIRRLAP